jgi:hypothetical protein
MSNPSTRALSDALARIAELEAELSRAAFTISNAITASFGEEHMRRQLRATINSLKTI